MYINIGQEDQMMISGYKLVRCRQIFIWIAIVMTIGILRLIFYWKPHWMIICSCIQSSLNDIDYVILKDSYQQIFVSKIKCNNFTQNQLIDLDWKMNLDKNIKKNYQDQIQKQYNSQCYFYCKKIKYIWNPLQQQYEKLRGLDEGVSCSYFHQSKGLSLETQINWRNLYGNNSIIIHVVPVLKLLVTQALDPFYIFQLFSIILWYIDDYKFYASCIAIISIISLATQVFQTRAIQRALKHTLTPSSIVSVYRSDSLDYESIPSDLLVPGDLIEIQRYGCIMQCDAVLINGNCIVNESMLTGESVPTTKTPIPNSVLSSGEDEMFNILEHSRHILFCGTNVIQTRYYDNQKVRAVVIRTGFSTAKGELMRSILYPKPVDFKFTHDAFKFVGMLAVIATIGMIYTIILMIQHGESIERIIIRSLDLITIVIPPALPAAMTIGSVFAQKRLKSKHIFCIQPRCINLSGAINTFCFDKTGTLTEEGLDMYCVVSADRINFGEEETISNLGISSSIIHAMATCHSLTVIEGSLNGDPLDLKMFQSTNWELEEPGEDATKYDVFMPTIVHPKISTVPLENYQQTSLPLEIGILRQFTFSSKLQRMSVITRQLDSHHFTLFTKGSPEMIASLCQQNTIPENFNECLLYYTQQGYRVIGIARRVLTKLTYVKIQRIQRELVECELEFLGLLVFENRLKIESTSVIQTLKSANIKCIMVTGDNLLTALSVARDCEILDVHDCVIIINAHSSQQIKPIIKFDVHEHVKRKIILTQNENENDACIIGNKQYAVDGKSWATIRKHFPDMLNKIVVRGSVFARFLPEQKQQLVETLQELGYYVGMCGDGANDCGALKTAHAGISLSEAESSVASPFTSQEQNIKCVLDVIKEGRAALVTSFGIFKFMAGYSMTQFLSVCLLYWIGANLTDFTFLYIDLVLLTSLGITFCYTQAFDLLNPKPPRTTLLAVSPILSLILTLLVNLLFQVVSWKVTTLQPWFVPFIPNDDKDYQCYEVTVVFSISAFQYITMSIIYAKGPPFRKIIFSNYLFIANIIISLLITIYVTVYPFNGLSNLMELRLSPSITFRIIIVGMALLNFFVSIFMEVILVETFVDGKCMAAYENISNKQHLTYMNLDSIVDDDINKSIMLSQDGDKNIIENSEFSNLDEIELLNQKKEENLNTHELCRHNISIL